MRAFKWSVTFWDVHFGFFLFCFCHHIWRCAHILTCKHMCACANAYKCVPMHAHVCQYIYAYDSECPSVPTCACIGVHTCACQNIYAYTKTCSHAKTSVHICQYLSSVCVISCISLLWHKSSHAPTHTGYAHHIYAYVKYMHVHLYICQIHAYTQQHKRVSAAIWTQVHACVGIRHTCMYWHMSTCCPDMHTHVQHIPTCVHMPRRCLHVYWHIPQQHMHVYTNTMHADVLVYMPIYALVNTCLCHYIAYICQHVCTHACMQKTARP